MLQDLILLAVALACGAGLAALYLRRGARWGAPHSDANAAGSADHAADIARIEGLNVLGDTALDLVADAVIYLDRERRITHANKAARTLVPLQEGQRVIEAMRDHELENLLRRSIAQGEQQSAVVRLSRPSRIVRASVRPVGGVGLVMVLWDETEVQHLQRVRRELVANVSHELRTPLATLQLLVETLIEGAAEDPQERRYFLDKLKEQVGHLTEIVQQSLQLASLESGESRVLAMPMRADALVRQSVARLAPQATRARVALEVELPPDLPSVRADPDQVARVITNILDNAIRVTPAGGRVTITAARADSHLRFEVRDTGPGVPRERLPRLFERFYTGDESRSGRGTGLGLAIAKHTVQLHGGEIWAESEEGRGARFYFTLPVAPDEAAVPTR